MYFESICQKALLGEEFGSGNSETRWGLVEAIWRLNPAALSIRPTLCTCLNDFQMRVSWTQTLQTSKTLQHNFSSDLQWPVAATATLCHRSISTVAGTRLDCSANFRVCICKLSPNRLSVSLARAPTHHSTFDVAGCGSGITCLPHLTGGTSHCSSTFFVATTRSY